MKTLLSWAGAIALALMPACALAQSATSVQAPAGFAPIQAPCVKQSDGICAAVDAAHPLPADTVVRATATDRGAIVGTTAVTLMPANTGRRGFSIQNQSASATCYINGQATATADYHSLLIAPGQLYETPPTHVGTGAVSVICSAASTSLYAREF